VSVLRAHGPFRIPLLGFTLLIPDFMTRLGITGGIAMGKSVCGEILRGMDIPVVDTDDLARRLVAPGEPALVEIERAFGPTVITSDGTLNRSALAQRVFGSADERATLEAILHPRIRNGWLRQTRSWMEEGRPIVAVIIPLLFETRAEAHFDATVCVSCSQVTQIERLGARGWDLDQSRARIEAQWPVEKKMSLANFVVWTEGLVEAHRAQVERIIQIACKAV
jgi:dephospho-CoA kinase